MNMPLVSVIVPTYNGAKRITKTLQSIIDQDYENLEIIVVDDVSTDNTVEVVQEVLKNSVRKFQIIKRTVNGRQSAARNTGFRAANGKYVIFFDHDDLAEKNFVSCLCREAEAQNADIVFGGFKQYNEAKNEYEIFYPVVPSQKVLFPEDYVKAWAHREMFICCVWCCIFRKDFIAREKLKFPEDCYISEDREFMLKAFAVSSCTSFIKIANYIYIIHAEQQSMADTLNRHNCRTYEQEVISAWRAGRFVMKRIKDKSVKNFIFESCIAQRIAKRFTLCAQDGDREYYDLKIKNLKHKKIREILLGTFNFIFSEPELFFKALMLLYAPNLYYRLRSKK